MAVSKHLTSVPPEFGGSVTNFSNHFNNINSNDAVYYTADTQWSGGMDANKINPNIFTGNGTVSTDDITLGGISMTETLTKIKDRLAILDEPDPEKLKKFAALQKAYEQYKLLEKLCFESEDEL